MKEYPVLPIPESIQKLTQRLTDTKSELSTTVSLEYFTESAKRVQQNSKLAYVMMNAYTFEKRPKYVNIRQELLEAGKIEAVILTPCRMFESTNIPVSVIVIGENNSGSVMFVNASKIFHEELRKATDSKL